MKQSVNAINNKIYQIPSGVDDSKNLEHFLERNSGKSNCCSGWVLSVL